MAGYSPLKITGNSTGLVQEREEFLLPDDAYPVLQNAYVWRERILRKQGFELLGRLQRNIGTTDGSGNAVILITPLPIATGTSIFQIGTELFTDAGNVPDPGIETLRTNSVSGASGTLDRISGTLTINNSNMNTPIQYFPGLPVMGIRIRELQNSANDETVFFDQNYAYIFDSTTNQFREFILGTTWNAGNEGIAGIDFFWSTNYWVSAPLISTTSVPPAYKTAFTTSNVKLFWVTNNSGHSGINADPPRITDGTTWLDFYHDTSPIINSPWAQINGTPTFLTNWLCNLPFRGRMVVFNTWEGPDATNSLNFSNRIRWSTIGNPFIAYSNGPPAKGSWRDDIRGQGGFLDIPTSEDIISIGFVRDNLVIYCERSTWQLRYTGRSIAPFQIEKVNSELGTESTFSSVQFDTSLVGIGDKGIVECDSYKSERIDIKIPDFVFQFNSVNNGVARVQGIRDFPNRLAYWTVPLAGFYDAALMTNNQIFPNVRLLYNYENDSWATFTDSLTTLGNYQFQSNRRWIDVDAPWIDCPFTWIDQSQSFPSIVGGNQQGFIEILDELSFNDVSLFITSMTQLTTVSVRSPNHNLKTGDVIGISGILGLANNFIDLNDGIFGIVVTDSNNFLIYTYNSSTNSFSNNVTSGSSPAYVGGGMINIRENFSITSKKFNFLDEGQNIQMGYLDILMDSTENGAIALNVYLDYNDGNVSNTLPDNVINGTSPAQTDSFFNSIIPTSSSSLNNIGGTKFWQRVYCPTRANFLTLEYTFNNAQMNGIEQQLGVQIDAQVLYIRRAGRMSQA